MTETRDVNKLSDMEIDEVSLVDQPANDHAKVVLSKRDQEVEGAGDGVDKASPDASSSSVAGKAEDEDEEEEEAQPPQANEATEEEDEKGFFKSLVDKVLGGGESKTGAESVGKIPNDDVNKATQGPQIPFGQQQQGQPAPGIQSGGPPGMQAFPAQQQGQQPQMPVQGGQQQMGQQMPGQMQQGPPIPDEVVEYIQQLEQALAQAQGTGQMEQQPRQGSSGQEAGVSKNDEALSEDESQFLSELAKSLDDEDQREAIAKAREAVEKAEQRASQAEEIAKAERDHRLTEEYVAKAKAYTNLPVSPQDFGGVLKRLHETMDEQDVAQIEKALSTANETAARIYAFDEIGKAGTSENEPVSKIDQEARSLIEKSGNEMSIEQAREQVLSQNPSLYEEYLNEVGS